MPFIRNEETMRFDMPFITNQDNAMKPAELKRTNEEQPGAEMAKTFFEETGDAQVEPIEVSAYGTAVWLGELV